MNISEEIKRLHALHQSGALTDEEFTRAKAKLLSGQPYQRQAPVEKGDVVTQLNQLRRSTTDRWLGGVCGGLARSTSLESWLWRLIFVVFSFCFGSGLLVYLLAWIFMPLEE